MLLFSAVINLMEINRLYISSGIYILDLHPLELTVDRLFVFAVVGLCVLIMACD